MRSAGCVTGLAERTVSFYLLNFMDCSKTAEFNRFQQIIDHVQFISCNA